MKHGSDFYSKIYGQIYARKLLKSEKNKIDNSIELKDSCDIIDEFKPACQMSVVKLSYAAHVDARQYDALNPLLQWFKTLHLHNDIISSCVLNPILGWRSFMHIIVICMYIYQSSRVAVTVTGVFIEQNDQNSSALTTFFDECTCCEIDAYHYYLIIMSQIYSLPLVIRNSTFLKQNFGGFGPKHCGKIENLEKSFSP